MAAVARILTVEAVAVAARIVCRRARKEIVVGAKKLLKKLRSYQNRLLIQIIKN